MGHITKSLKQCKHSHCRTYNYSTMQPGVFSPAHLMLPNYESTPDVAGMVPLQGSHMPAINPAIKVALTLIYVHSAAAIQILICCLYPVAIMFNHLQCSFISYNPACRQQKHHKCDNASHHATH